MFIRPFAYQPQEHELEKASSSYLMSVVIFMIGLPFPIINLLATLGFYLSNRRSTYFVRWHCTQALLSQLAVVMMNSAAFVWIFSVLFLDGEITNPFIAYVITVVLSNITEFVGTIYAAIKIRKGTHVEWYFFGALTNAICKPSTSNNLFTNSFTSAPQNL